MATFLLLMLSYHLIARALPLNSPLLDSYDYIVVGSGPGGLTVANRLSEDPSINVLLLEAGPADQGEPWIRIPFFAGEGVGSTYDWNLGTTPQTYLDGLPRPLPQGRALGGGTTINAMLWNRGGAGDYDDWVTLGNPGWGWSDILPYFMRSETYTSYPSEAIANADSIGFDPFVHGFYGPVNVSYSAFIYNQTANLFSALSDLGIPTALDLNDGNITGASFMPVSIEPINQTRADARTAYYEPYTARPNLWVSTGQHVTRILFENGEGNWNSSSVLPANSNLGQGNATTDNAGLFGSSPQRNMTTSSILSDLNMPPLLSHMMRVIRRWTSSRKRQLTGINPSSTGSNMRAIGVEFAPNTSTPRQNISATREVIVSAGAIHTPQLLKLSGIGPSNELQVLQIPVLVDLPGVGHNLQDHVLVGAYYPYQNQSYLTSVQIRNNNTLMAEAASQFTDDHSGPWTSGPPDGNAFPALPFIVNGSNSIITAAQAQTADQYLLAGSDVTVIAGFDAQRRLLIQALQDRRRAAYELLNFNYGAFSNANMRPFSRGTVTLNTSEPFDPPIIDPRYGSNPVDLEVLLASVLFNRRILAQEAMQVLEPLQIRPPLNASDDEVMQMIKANVETEYHPSGSCAMLPLNLGGVVDPSLRVYGTQNLRIVDASIMPMVPASHLQAVVYGIAEKAADMIRSARVNNTSTVVNPSSAAIPSGFMTSIVRSNDDSVTTLSTSAVSSSVSTSGTTSTTYVTV